MRAPTTGTVRGAIGLLLIVAAAGLLPSGQARAEAPYFYDDLYDVAFYDPDFTPANRPVGYLALYGQGWSIPRTPGEDLGDQDLFGVYRGRWSTPLDDKTALLVEAKGAARDDIAADDYVVKAEFTYRGLDAPVWIYGGMRVPEKTDFLVYGGVETLSYKIEDLFHDVEETLPIAGKGYAEIRWDLDDENPTLRLVALTHTIRDWLGPFTAAAPFEVFLREGDRPVWIFQPHLDLNVTDGFFRLDVTSGYAVELRDGGEERIAVGLRAALGSAGF